MLSQEGVQPLPEAGDHALCMWDFKLFMEVPDRNGILFQNTIIKIAGKVSGTDTIHEVETWDKLTVAARWTPNMNMDWNIKSEEWITDQY